jgi:queuine tRNA-ribosyltransferase
MSKLRKYDIPTLHGSIQTPAFLPDATYGAVHSLSFDDVASTGVKELVTTTLHLELKLGSEYVEQYGGLHKFFNWQRPILTDSGGFQVFSLIHRRGNKFNFINDHGAHFRSPENGTVHTLTPETSMQIQKRLGSDIRVVLDEPLALNATKEANEHSVSITTKWAIRSKDEFLKIENIKESEYNSYKIGDKVNRPLLTAVVQGSNDLPMRKRSAEELQEIVFDGYNFGGLPTKPDGTLDLELSEYLVDLLPEDKIRYAMGIGTPDDIIKLAHMGWDLFDCVLPTRNARHGYLYVPKGEGDVDYENYSVLHVKSERYKNADEPITSVTHPALKSVSRAYLRHLIKIHEPAGHRLATLHNLHFYNNVISQIASK